MTSDQPEKKYDALLWDMDGVLINVSHSYREAIRRTAQMFSGKKEVTKEEIEQIKRVPGFNNDWDATYALVQKLDNPDFQVGEIVKELETIRQSAKYGKMKQVFQSLYLGRDLYYEFYGEEPTMHVEKGLIYNETAMLSRTDLKELHQIYGRMGIVTSRPRFETEHTLLINHIRDLFEVIICQEDAKHEKPHPEPILKAIRLLNCQKPVYLGDTINDVLAASAAQIECIYVNQQILVSQQTVTPQEAFRYLSFKNDPQIQEPRDIEALEMKNVQAADSEEEFFFRQPPPQNPA
jgi:HAD superfamily hydrolase (TIGR01548 family)